MTCVLIGNFTGTDHCSLESTKRQLEHLLDERYQIRYCCKPEDIPPASCIKLIVMPGGDYSQMEPSIKSLAYKIYHLVVNKGVSYLGFGAGALATFDQIHFKNSHLPSKQGIGIFPWDCCKSDGNECASHVQITTGAVSTGHSYPLFLLAKDHFSFSEEKGQVLMQYSSCQKQETAAIICKAGSAQMVLSNVHPEMDAEAVEILYPRIFSSYRERSIYERGQKETLQVFLQRLGLNTKTTFSER